MRRPVGVKSFEIGVSSYLIFLRPDIRFLLAGEAAVKAERSEFILSLDGGRNQP
jgi:hypothetical protein